MCGGVWMLGVRGWFGCVCIWIRRWWWCPPHRGDPNTSLPSNTPHQQGPKEAAITVYERKLEEAEKAKEAWKEARKEARCVLGCLLGGIVWGWLGVYISAVTCRSLLPY